MSPRADDRLVERHAEFSAQRHEFSAERERLCGLAGTGVGQLGDTSRWNRATALYYAANVELGAIEARQDREWKRHRRRVDEIFAEPVEPSVPGGGHG